MRLARIQPLYVHIATLFLALFLVLGALQAVMGYRRSYADHYARNQELFKRQSHEIEAALGLRLSLAQQSLRMQAFSPVTRARTLEERLQALPQFAQALGGEHGVSAMYIGYLDGDFFLLRPLDSAAKAVLPPGVPDGTRFLAQSRHLEKGMRTGAFLFLDSSLNLLRKAARPDYVYDPRTRDWFKEAQREQGFALARPYLFYTTREPGTTLALAVQGGRAVLGADLSMGQLSGLLQELPRPMGSSLVLSDDSGHMVATTCPLPIDALSWRLPRLDAMDMAVLRSLQALLPRQLEPGMNQRLEIVLDEGRWLVEVYALTASRRYPLLLSLLVPERHLLEQAQANALGTLWPLLATLLLFLPAIWLVAKYTARPLQKLREEAKAIREFDFSGSERPRSHILEIEELSEALAHAKGTIREFMDIGKALGAERQFTEQLTTLLRKSLDAVDAYGGVLYLRGNSDGFMPAERAFFGEEERTGLMPLDSHHCLHGVAHGLRFVQELSVGDWQRDFGELSPYDKRHLVVAVPLCDHRQEVMGVLCMVLPEQSHEEGQARLALVEALAGSYGAALETQQLLAGQKKLLESLIELLAGAIDAKSPYTGGHCQRVPQLALLLASAATTSTSGPFANYYLDDEAWEALHLASWLHDCGKVTTPEYVVDKATRLETLYDRIHEIRMRFEVIKREAHIEALEAVLSPERRASIENALQPLWKELDGEFAFVASCNTGEHNLDTGAQARLRAIGQREWTRTLDAGLGVSHEERKRQAKNPPSPLPCREPLLSDRPDHLFERPEAERIGKDEGKGFAMHEPAYQYNRGELYNLSLEKGTLSPEERYQINLHIVETIRMLEKLPFPRHLRSVPSIAGGHHECPDGSGYPRGLKEAQLPLEARILAVADIFEALTASDRPYKEGKTVSEALSIMAEMARKGHIDRSVFALLVQSHVWKSYGSKFLHPAQIDEVDAQALLDIVKKTA